MNLYFAEYAPEAHGVPLDDMAVGLGAESDLPDCGRLWAQREGGDPRVWTRRLSLASFGRNALFVAEARGRIVGYGRVAWLTPVADGGRNAPDGWYLSGMVVEPALCRRGVGRALTQARCAWVWERGEPVYYVVNSANRASLDLHREIGFREVTRDFSVPSVTFTGEGEGILCACGPSTKREQVVQLNVRAAR